MGQSNIDKICHSKTGYETWEEANSTAEYLYETENLDLDIYKCPICGMYHLTSKRRRKR